MSSADDPNPKKTPRQWDSDLVQDTLEGMDVISLERFQRHADRIRARREKKDRRGTEEHGRHTPPAEPEPTTDQDPTPTSPESQGQVHANVNTQSAGEYELSGNLRFRVAGVFKIAAVVAVVGLSVACCLWAVRELVELFRAGA